MYSADRAGSRGSTRVPTDWVLRLWGPGPPSKRRGVGHAGFPGPVLPAVRFLSHWELRLALLEYFDLDFEIFLYFLISYLADVAIGAVG